MGKGRATAGMVMPLESPFGLSVPMSGLTKVTGAVSAAWAAAGLGNAGLTVPVLAAPAGARLPAPESDATYSVQSSCAVKPVHSFQMSAV